MFHSPSFQIRFSKPVMLARFGLLAAATGLAAGCSSDAMRLAGPAFTGSTSNQQAIIGTSGRYAMPAYTNPYPAVPVQNAAASSVVRQALPPQPVGTRSTYQAATYTPAAPASGPKPYTPPKPYATANTLAPQSLNQQAARIAQSSAPAKVSPAVSTPKNVQVASIEPSTPGLPSPRPSRTPETRQIAVATRPSNPVPALRPSVSDTLGKSRVASAPDISPLQSEGFRWPVRGRIIANFGTKANGEKNDGINLAVPEGTSVKAAEDGVVIYAGNELKSYGNLVLIRHKDGWVSAYAHNRSINVKRGEDIRRGQIIAAAGMTGAVTSPQVHFELRKGATPVDPLEHLSQA